MAKIKNKRIYNSDPTVLATLREEYTGMGFDTGMEQDCLVVFALRRKKHKPKKDTREERSTKE